MLGGGLGLVQALQGPVVALVEPPGAAHRDPVEVHLVQRELQRRDRAAQKRGEGLVEAEPRLPEQLAGVVGFLHALLAEGDVHPAGEAVLLVPVAFAVAHEDELFHGEGE